MISTGTATYRIATSIFALSVVFLIFTVNPVEIKKKNSEIIKRFEADQQLIALLKNNKAKLSTQSVAIAG